MYGLLIGCWFLIISIIYWNCFGVSSLYKSRLMIGIRSFTNMGDAYEN